MKLDEFAFFNQQLAAMLRDGIPLESALGQLCSSMRRGDLRDELEKLRADLANGVPIQQALAARKLPPFYVQMIQVGVQSNDLPGMLILVADYYQRASLIGMRLKGLMVYPLIVLLATVALSGWLTFFVFQFYRAFAEDLIGGFGPPTKLLPLEVLLWAPLIFLLLIVVIVFVSISIPAFRRSLQWRAPAFREASLARIAFALTMMLKGGCTLAESVTLVQQMENGTPGGRELAIWHSRMKEGQTSFSQIAAGRTVIPGMFVWIVTSAKENLAEGFQRAAEIYQARALHRIEILLYAALPTAVLVLGGLLCAQLYSFFVILSQIISLLGS
jgi:type II secretory pathway component PulF